MSVTFAETTELELVVLPVAMSDEDPGEEGSDSDEGFEDGEEFEGEEIGDDEEFEEEEDGE